MALNIPTRPYRTEAPALPKVSPNVTTLPAKVKILCSRDGFEKKFPEHLVGSQATENQTCTTFLPVENGSDPSLNCSRSLASTTIWQLSTITQAN